MELIKLASWSTGVVVRCPIHFGRFSFEMRPIVGMSHVLFSFLFCLWCGRQRERLSKAARVWKTNAKFSTQRCFSKMDQLKLSHLVLLRCEICIQEFRSAVPPFLLCTAILHTLFKLTVLRYLNGTCSRGYCMDGKRMLCNYSSKRKGYGTVLLRGWPKMPLLYVVRFLRENIHYTTVEGCVGSDWIYWLFIYLSIFTFLLRGYIPPDGMKSMTIHCPRINSGIE